MEKKYGVLENVGCRDLGERCDRKLSEGQKFKLRRKYGEKGTLLPCWWECKLVIITMENSMEVP